MVYSKAKRRRTEGPRARVAVMAWWIAKQSTTKRIACGGQAGWESGGGAGVRRRLGWLDERNERASRPELIGGSVWVRGCVRDRTSENERRRGQTGKESVARTRQDTPEEECRSGKRRDSRRGRAGAAHHKRHDAHVREPGGGRGRLDELDAVLAEPVPHLDEEERDEHDDEARVELLAEDGHRQAGLHQRVFGLVEDALDLRLPERPEEDTFQKASEAEEEREGEVAEDADGQLARRQVHDRGVELLPA